MARSAGSDASWCKPHPGLSQFRDSGMDVVHPQSDVIQCWNVHLRTTNFVDCCVVLGARAREAVRGQAMLHEWVRARAWNVGGCANELDTNRVVVCHRTFGARDGSIGCMRSISTENGGLPSCKMSSSTFSD